MNKKKIQKIFLVPLFFILLLIFFFKFYNQDITKQVDLDNIKNENTGSNIIKEISFSSRDEKGNEYLLKALEGEVDLTNDKIIYLKKITAQVILENSEDIIIVSNFGKYNIENYDTVFSQDVIIKFLDNKISSNYMEFSISRNLMTIAKDVIYSSNKSFLKADTIELNINTKDINIFMLDSSKKVKITNKN